MWQFITDHGAALTVIVTAVTLVVWTIYGQLMAANQKRQQKTSLFIKQGDGTGFDSMCLFSNMGKESVYLRGVFIDLYTSDGERFTEVVEKDWQEEPAACTAQDIGQGPVGASQQLAVGPFRRLVLEAARKAGLNCCSDASDDDTLWQQLRSFKITAIVTVGPYEQIVGAERSFEIAPSEGKLRPGRAGTILRQSARDARSLQGYLTTLTEQNR